MTVLSTMKCSDVPQIDSDAFINEQDREDFWDNIPFLTACKSWLAFHHYTLYDLTKDDCDNTIASPVLPPPETSHVSYPYAFFSYDKDTPVQPLGGYRTRITYAQDALRRDVVIKIVERGSQEFLVYQNLFESTKLPIPAPGVMRPVDLLISPHNFAFVVMPRWGDDTYYPEFGTIRQTLSYIASLVHGLAFLHSRRIVHRDLRYANILINHFDRNATPGMDPTGRQSYVDRMSLLERGLVQYCLFDFDISMIFPPDAPAVECRLDASLSTWGMPCFHPPDTKQGEFDYDPFAFDVACLGNVLARYDFAIPKIPLLAPLLDGMTTHMISRRFTALEAANFCDNILENMSPEQLDAPIPIEPDPAERRVVKDRWESLPLDFVAKWSCYRETPPSLPSRILRWFSDHRLTSGLLRLVRRTFRI